eukprot:CAMPEP_0194027106 /NCGR_PEP_ID=MMETSP0009_2-20130614/1329_1 /TAXON_ID=210454 /ORGANISM="Grammatophora oceanica, Strain CCMP 410" /LENGTH=200 /DNA_ID=CAMNT_0038666057 /DNA_START=108 /DNA_END=710 /DNA_ORIENTATION=+
MFSARVALYTSAVLITVFWVNFFGLAFYRVHALKAQQDRRSEANAKVESGDVTRMNHMVLCQNELSPLSDDSSSTTFRLTQESANAWKDIIHRLPQEVTFSNLIMAQLTQGRLPDSSRKLCQELRNILDQNEQGLEANDTEMSTMTVVIERETEQPFSTTPSSLVVQSLVVQGREALRSFFFPGGEQGPVSLRGAAEKQD